jgi:LysR family hydrogen peroxide-inducible transcriptional activator
MTLQQMLYLVALDNHRSFVRAAESCLVSQPTLSMQIQKLEEEVGAMLMDRTKHPIEPTPIGHELITSARKVLAEVNAVKSKINNEVERLDGTFSLGVIPTVAPYLLPRWLPFFLKDDTPMQLRISELRTNEIVDQLKRGVLDIGILATPLQDDALFEIPLYYEPFQLYVSGTHALSKKTLIKVDDLDVSDMLLLEEGHCFRAQALALCGSAERSKNEKVSYHAGSLETIIGMVERGVGYTLLPALAALNVPSPTLLKNFSGTAPVREISIVVHRRFPRQAVLDHLKKWIQTAIPQNLVQPKKYKRIGWI